LSEKILLEQVEKATEKPLLGFIGGDPGVNVLKLNLALDGIGGKETANP
jgi:K+-transporting ATPase c subunit